MLISQLASLDICLSLGTAGTLSLDGQLGSQLCLLLLREGQAKFNEPCELEQFMLNDEPAEQGHLVG